MESSKRPEGSGDPLLPDLDGGDDEASPVALPNADSPQVLTRLVELLARGVRTGRALQEALGVDARTVRSYFGAARWLGLLEEDEDTWLTPLGLEYAYADVDRPAIYARAVWSTPFVGALMSGRDPDLLPPVDEVTRAVVAAEPSLAPSAARRRAEALRGLLAPALGPAARAPVAHQLDLPLPAAAPRAVPARLSLEGSLDSHPDVYRFLLASLVDHGELTLGQIRGLLDEAGAHQAPIGGYVDMALGRGDATRHDDRLVVSAAAVAWADLANSTPSVILSDPGYRRWLEDLLTADRDRHAQIRRSEKWARLMPWDKRLFGRPAAPETLRPDLERVLMDRSIEAFPIRGSAGEALTVETAPFLEVWRQAGLPVALPPTLADLRHGLARVNDVLRRAREGRSSVGAPDLAHRPLAVHGGLLHPGEPLPRGVPDQRSLRMRLLSNAPYAALMTALLLLHRLDAGLEVRERRGQWILRVRRHPVGHVLPVLDGFARARGWIVSRRSAGGLDAAGLLDALEHAGIAVLVAGRAVLAEPFFNHLRREAEEMDLYDAIEPLGEALSDHLHALPPHEER